MDIINVSFHIQVIAYLMFPKSPLPNPFFALSQFAFAAIWRSR